MPRSQALRFFPVEHDRFVKSKHVQAMRGEARSLYLLLLSAMWANGGWLKHDDHILAGILDLSVRRWRRLYRDQVLTSFVPRMDQVVGPILIHPVLDEVRNETLQRLKKERARTAPARARAAEKKAKSAPPQESKPAPVTAPVTVKPPASVTSRVTGHPDVPVTGWKEKEEETLPINRERVSSSQMVPSERPVERSPVAAPAVEAAALPATLLSAASEPIPITDKLLKTPIVSGRPKTLSDIARELSEEEDDA